MEAVGSFLTLEAYLIIYTAVIIVPTISPNNLKYMPSVKFMPAAFDAITAEKGFTVDIIVPTHEPIYMAAIHTIASYLAAKNTGTNIG